MACSKSNIDFEKLRIEGNEIYLSVDDGLPPVLQIYRLEKAISKYTKALEIANNVSDCASALKNIGIVSLKVAKVLAAKNEFLRVKYYLTDSIKSFSSSYLNGKSFKPTEWVMELEEKISCSGSSSYF